MRKVENQNKEFKQAWNENCLKTICAFANTAGGKLYIGIDDAGKAVGVKDAAKYLDDIPNKTKDILGITPEVTVKKVARKEVIEVSVAYSSTPISYMGAHTQLRISPDGLNLWNAGGLPPGISIDDLKKWHLSKPRNEFLADVFFKGGMIEAWGRGTIKIIDECKKAGLPEPEFREEFGGFSVFFRKEELGESGEKAGRKRGDKVGDKVGGKVGEKLSVNQQKIIEHIKKAPSISARELSPLIGISQRKIEENIAKLKAMGILKRIGPDKGGAWRVNG